MSRYCRANILSLAILIVLYACQPTQPKISGKLEDSFQKLIPVDAVNNSFQVVVDPGKQGELKLESDIRIAIQNVSEQEIYFPVGFGIRMFVIRDNEWVEIQNNNEYFGEGSLLFPKSEHQLGDRISTAVRPSLPPQIDATAEQEVLRIVLIGELMSDGKKTGNPVAAYTDVFVQP